MNSRCISTYMPAFSVSWKYGSIFCPYFTALRSLKELAAVQPNIMNVIKQNVIEVSLPLPEYPVLADLMSTAPYKLSEKEEGVISTN